MFCGLYTEPDEPHNSNRMHVSLIHFVPPSSTSLPSETVFKTSELVPTFETLGARGCLPEKFDREDSLQPARECAQLVDSGCSGVPTVARFYNCLADG